MTATQQPKVSIVTATFNRGDWIARCIESIAAQKRRAARVFAQARENRSVTVDLLTRCRLSGYYLL